MSATAYVHGHPVHYDLDAKEWRYQDGIPARIPRPCPRCECLPTPDGHDACLGDIPGATAACCGHGKVDGYIHYTNGRHVRLATPRHHVSWLLRVVGR